MRKRKRGRGREKVRGSLIEEDSEGRGRAMENAMKRSGGTWREYVV